MDRVTICSIVCPTACRIAVTIDENGEIVTLDNANCKQGREYARQEVLNPVRTLTTTVRIESADKEHPLLPVQTEKAIPKKLLMPAMRELSGVSITPPVHYGDVVAKDIAGSGVDVIANVEVLS